MPPKVTNQRRLGDRGSLNSSGNGLNLELLKKEVKNMSFADLNKINLQSVVKMPLENPLSSDGSSDFLSSNGPIRNAVHV